VDGQVVPALLSAKV